MGGRVPTQSAMRVQLLWLQLRLILGRPMSALRTAGLWSSGSSLVRLHWVCAAGFATRLSAELRFGLGLDHGLGWRLLRVRLGLHHLCWELDICRTVLQNTGLITVSATATTLTGAPPKPIQPSIHVRGTGSRQAASSKAASSNQ